MKNNKKKINKAYMIYSFDEIKRILKEESIKLNRLNNSSFNNVNNINNNKYIDIKNYSNIYKRLVINYSYFKYLTLVINSNNNINLSSKNDRLIRRINNIINTSLMLIKKDKEYSYNPFLKHYYKKINKLISLNNNSNSNSNSNKEYEFEDIKNNVVRYINESINKLILKVKEDSYSLLLYSSLKDNIDINNNINNINKDNIIIEYSLLSNQLDNNELSFNKKEYIKDNDDINNTNSIINLDIYDLVAKLLYNDLFKSYKLDILDKEIENIFYILVKSYFISSLNINDVSLYQSLFLNNDCYYLLLSSSSIKNEEDKRNIIKKGKNYYLKFNEETLKINRIIVFNKKNKDDLEKLNNNKNIEIVNYGNE